MISLKEIMIPRVRENRVWSLEFTLIYIYIYIYTHQMGDELIVSWYHALFFQTDRKTLHTRSIP